MGHTFFNCYGSFFYETWCISSLLKISITYLLPRNDLVLYLCTDLLAWLFLQCMGYHHSFCILFCLFHTFCLRFERLDEGKIRQVLASCILISWSGYCPINWSQKFPLEKLITLTIRKCRTEWRKIRKF